MLVFQVRDAINAAGYYCEADVSDRKLQKKVSFMLNQFRLMRFQFLPENLCCD